MKLSFIIVLTAIVFAGCTKSSNITPQNDNAAKTDTTKTSGTGTSAGTGTNSGTALNSGLTHDDSVHMAVLRIYPQKAKTMVSGPKLIVSYDENVDLFFVASYYQNISAVHLQENFQKSMLAGFDFTTVAAAGNVTLDWVDDNLNNVVQKTVSDTVIDKVNVVKVNVRRTFTFFKTYASSQDALAAQEQFLTQRNDIIGFSSYTYYNQKNYPAVSALVAMSYTK